MNMTQPMDEPVLSVAELRQLVAGRGDPTETLNSVGRLIRTGLQTNVCSVYLIEPDRTHLIPAATCVPSVCARCERLQEGLAGLVVQELRPIVVDRSARS